MAWHYNSENSPSSPGAVEASWEGTCLDGAPSALLSLLPTHAASYLQGNGTECYQPSHAGMTSEPSTASLGAEASMSSAEDSPARTSASPERVTALMESAADCGPKWPGSLARYNPGSRSWRTAQCSLLGGLTRYSATFPRWGMMRSGELWEQTTPVLPTVESAFGYLPTPLANDWSSPKRNKPQKGGSPLREVIANTPSGNWPTPTCADAFTDKLKSSQQQEGSMHSVNLSQAVKMWPTPIVWDAITSGFAPERIAKDAAKRQDSLTRATASDVAAHGGALNPDWVEWLMNWPIGWTSMEPLNPGRLLAWLRASPSVPTASSASVTDKCQQPQCLHGQPSTNG